MRRDEHAIAKHVALPVVSALATLHALGLQHRDVKPENLVVDASSRVYLSDFGFAARPRRRRAVTRVGTLPFMAPEVLLDDPADPGTLRESVPRERRTPYTTKVDVWSLAVTLCELLFGETPFDGATDSETAANVVRGRAPALEGRLATLSGAGQDFLRRCLSADPGARPSAGELYSHPWLRGHVSREAWEALAPETWARASPGAAVPVGRGGAAGPGPGPGPGPAPPGGQLAGARSRPLPTDAGAPGPGGAGSPSGPRDEAVPSETHRWAAWPGARGPTHALAERQPPDYQGAIAGSGGEAGVATGVAPRVQSGPCLGGPRPGDRGPRRLVSSRSPSASVSRRRVEAGAQGGPPARGAAAPSPALARGGRDPSGLFAAGEEPPPRASALRFASRGCEAGAPGGAGGWGPAPSRGLSGDPALQVVSHQWVSGAPSDGTRSPLFSSRSSLEGGGREAHRPPYGSVELAGGWGGGAPRAGARSPRSPPLGGASALSAQLQASVAEALSNPASLSEALLGLSTARGGRVRGRRAGPLPGGPHSALEPRVRGPRSPAEDLRLLSAQESVPLQLVSEAAGSPRRREPLVLRAHPSAFDYDEVRGKFSEDGGSVGAAGDSVADRAERSLRGRAGPGAGADPGPRGGPATAASAPHPDPMSPGVLSGIGTLSGATQGAEPAWGQGPPSTAPRSSGGAPRRVAPAGEAPAPAPGPAPAPAPGPGPAPKAARALFRKIFKWRRRGHASAEGVAGR